MPDAGVPDAGSPDAGSPDAGSPDAGPGPFRLHLRRSGGGTIFAEASTINCGASCDDAFPKGSRVALSVRPDAKSTFLGWTGDCTGSSQSCSLSMESDKSVAATFSSCPGAVVWSRGFGGTGDDRATSLAIDPAGNLVVAGWFSSTLKWGSTQLDSAGGQDAFVVKLDPDGGLLWARAFGGSGTDLALAVVSGPGGAIFVAGRYQGTARFGAQTLVASGIDGAFLARLSGSDGTVEWARSFGANYRTAIRGVAVSAAGDLAIAGYFSDSVAFGATTLVSKGWEDAFVAKLSGADGAAIWARRAGGTQLDVANAVTFDASGDVVATGSVYPHLVDFDGVPFAGHGTGAINDHAADAYVVKYAGADGTQLWVHELGGAEPDEGTVVVASGTDILAGGSFGYEPSFQGFPGFNVQPNNAYLARLSPDGGEQWVKTLGPDHAAQAELALALPRDGGLEFTVAGSFQGSADFGTGRLVASGPSPADRFESWDAFVTQLDSSGKTLWAQRFGGIGDDQIFALARGPQGEIYAAGSFEGEADFCGAQSLRSSGGQDAFVLRLGPTPSSAPPAGPLLAPDFLVANPSDAGSLCVKPVAPQAPGPADGGVPSFVEIPFGSPTSDFANSVAVGDFNGGGSDHVFIAYGGAGPGSDRVTIWKNNGSGVLTDGTTSFLPAPLRIDGPSGAVAIDVLGDGHPGILINQGGPDHYPWPGAQTLLLRPQPDGTLRDVTLETLPIADRNGTPQAVVDLDCNGAPDIYPSPWPLDALFNDGHGTFASKNAVVLREGFTRSSNLFQTSTTFCDVNGDGAPDLIIGTTSIAEVYLFLNDGHGRLVMQPPGRFPAKPFVGAEAHQIVCVDADRDGRMDLAILFLNDLGLSQLALWHNRGDGTFADLTQTALPATGGSAQLLFAADLNGDGWPDLVVSGSGCGGQQTDTEGQLYLNRGGTFVEAPNIFPRRSGCSYLRPFNANGDARVDLLRLAANNGQSGVLVNTTAP